ncbi:hypothetical protein HGRIS_001565 [Hohenbuehelia grisea]|uniref:Uncharacterized protein n=1 Tax=Hohenbuehelia grisea TaxID=104357 RepID=A0ABR3JR82_9AGAR
MTALRASVIGTLRFWMRLTITSARQPSAGHVPVIDASYILERPTLTLKKGRLNGDTLLAISNAREGDIFINRTRLLPQEFSFVEYIHQLDSSSHILQLFCTAYLRHPSFFGRLFIVNLGFGDISKPERS